MPGEVSKSTAANAPSSREALRISELERELEAARAGLEKAKASSEAANLAKSRFLAAANHDLRQPLQTLELLQSLLAKAVIGDKAAKLVKRQNDTLSAMSEMLDTLRDLNQIQSGLVKADIEDCPISSLLHH